MLSQRNQVTVALDQGADHMIGKRGGLGDHLQVIDALSVGSLATGNLFLFRC